jgi:hypothetical protein
MTFVIGGYVTLVVNRWNTLRNTTLGILWGSLENLVVYSSYCCQGRGPATTSIRDDVLRYVFSGREMVLTEIQCRYARVVILLTFHAARAEDSIPVFQEKKLLTDTEAQYLQAAMVRSFNVKYASLTVLFVAGHPTLNGYNVDLAVF